MVSVFSEYCILLWLSLGAFRGREERRKWGESDGDGTAGLHSLTKARAGSRGEGGDGERATTAMGEELTRASRASAAEEDVNEGKNVSPN